MPHQPYNQSLKPFSKVLRSNMTDAEQRLWQHIRRKQLCDMQFYRQKPLLNYIVDFYCPQAKLVIECDGSQHYTEEGLTADALRDADLATLGITVLRFNNHQILTEIESVCGIIQTWIEQRIF